MRQVMPNQSRPCRHSHNNVAYILRSPGFFCSHLLLCVALVSNYLFLIASYFREMDIQSESIQELGSPEDIEPWF
jgi:hypothetical protein